MESRRERCTLYVGGYNECMYVCICQTEKIPSQQCDCKGNSIPVNHLQSVQGMMLKVILKHCVCVLLGEVMDIHIVPSSGVFLIVGYGIE